jgi:uncharacterized membrane protein
MIWVYNGAYWDWGAMLGLLFFGFLFLVLIIWSLSQLEKAWRERKEKEKQ